MVTPGQRQAIVRTVIARIHVTTAESWTLEVEWVGGARTVLKVTRPVRAQTPRRVAGYRRWRLDLSGYHFIRDQVIAGVPRRAIAERLDQRAPQSHGPWPLNQVSSVISMLRSGRIRGVERLPCPPTLYDRVRTLHAEGCSPRQIVAQLRSEGVLTKHRTIVTTTAIYGALRRLKLRPHSVAMERRVRDELRAWGASAPAAEIAARLNNMGLTTMSGAAWTPPYVRERLRKLGIRLVRSGRRALGHEEGHNQLGASDAAPGPAAVRPHRAESRERTLRRQRWRRSSLR
jgi:hypothetical protein